MSYETYIPRKSRLLKDFEKSIPRVKEVLFARYGEEEARSLIQESRQTYEDIIPQIPYIGGRNPMLNFFLLPASQVLAIYRTLRDHGRTVEEAGSLIYEIGEAEIQAIPGWVGRLIGVLWFSLWFTKRLHRRAEISQERKYSGDYVIAFIEGDGQDFDYGVDYIECASCKFFEEQDAAELSPYFCAKDKIASEMFGWGLRRTMTLAEGGQRCDFRFKKGGKTYVPIPESLSAG